MSVRDRTLIGALALAVVAAAACEREARPFRELPMASSRTPAEAQTPLVPGAPSASTAGESPFQANAWAISEGQRLYAAYNCVGCHAHGGGAIGPPLMDDEWIYGYTPENIYSTIVEGRPNGMPSFRNVPEYQVWQLVAYVQALSGLTPIDASPGRSDHLRPHAPETIRPYEGRRQTGHK
jgi:cytochrome c oxidase cbb3-type subunit 3